MLIYYRFLIQPKIWNKIDTIIEKKLINRIWYKWWRTRQVLLLRSFKSFLKRQMTIRIRMRTCTTPLHFSLELSPVVYLVCSKLVAAFGSIGWREAWRRSAWCRISSIFCRLFQAFHLRFAFWNFTENTNSLDCSQLLWWHISCRMWWSTGTWSDS